MIQNKHNRFGKNNKITYLELWSTKESDFPSTGSFEKQIKFICRYGALAPSVHNIQPWEFIIKGNSLRVCLSRERSLEFGDATGRQAWISLGACVENISRVSRNFGLKVIIDAGELTSGKAQPAIIITFKETVRRAADLDDIINRFSDRSYYDKSPLGRETVTSLEKAGKMPQADILITTDRKIIQQVADLTAKGIKAAFSNPSFRHELANLIHHKPTSPVGFTSESLNLGGVRGTYEKYLVKHGLNRISQSKIERMRIMNSGGLCFIFTQGDTAFFWYTAGRALQSVALNATKIGLRTNASAAVVEAFDFHSEIEQLLHQEGRLQVVLRVGKSQAKPLHTPRLPMAKTVK